MTRVVPPPKALLAQESQVQAVSINGNSMSDGHGHSTRIAHSYDPMQAGVSQEQLSAYLAGIQRLVNCLTDPDRSTRRQAATTLQSKLILGDAGSPTPSPALLQATVCGPLLHPLLGLLSDVAEKCRCVAAPGPQTQQRPTPPCRTCCHRLVGVEILCHVLATVPDCSAMLPALLPVLARRMGHLPVVEEVRAPATASS